MTNSNEIRKYITLLENTTSDSIYDRWNQFGAEDLANEVNGSVSILEKPVKTSGNTHKKEWDTTGVPVLKFFSKRFHTYDDEANNNVGTHTRNDLIIPAGTKVVVTNELAYMAHPEFGFVKTSRENFEVSKANS